MTETSPFSVYFAARPRNRCRWASYAPRNSIISASSAGVFVLAVLGNGMQLAGWNPYAQYIVRGVILLAAVAFDEYQKSLKMRVRR